METQTPAEGILIRNDWGDSKSYEITCECHDNDHNHTVFVEADEAGVSVNIYTTTTTPYWKKTVEERYDIDNVFLEKLDWFWKGFFNNLVNKLRLTWNVWVDGYVKYEVGICMSSQQALNYVRVLEQAVADVETFRNERNSKNQS